ncbi:MAG: M28 family peptidase [Bryobacteraceae bacterium]
MLVIMRWPALSLYDPSTQSFTATGDRLEARFWQNATFLTNGKVLIAGPKMWKVPARNALRVWPIVQEAARRLNVAIKPDAHPERGHYYRSDHFSFAHAGIPAFSIGLGTQLYGKPAGYGEKIAEEYLEKHYHQPSDEYREDWDFAGMEEAARFRHVDRDERSEPGETTDLEAGR